MSKSIQIWDHFSPLVFPKDSENLKSLDIGLWEVRETRRLNGVIKERKESAKKLFSPRRFWTIFEQKCSYLRPLLSITLTQGFRISKIFRHLILGSGGKKMFKIYLKSEQIKKKSVKKPLFVAAILDHFLSKNVQILDQFFLPLFSKDPESLTKLDSPLWKVGEKDV